MALTCEVVVDPEVTFDRPERLAELLEFAGTFEPSIGKRSLQMTLRLCDDATIADLHGRFFRDPTPTDVITFPGGDPVDDDGYLGDVVVSIDTAADQAADATHSMEREVAFLALHGLLHLCSYDDATDEDRDAMHHRQYVHLAAWEREYGRSW